MKKRKNKSYINKTFFISLGITLLIAALPCLIIASSQTKNANDIHSYAASNSGNSWLETFTGNSIDTAFWRVSNYAAPGAITNVHQAYYVPTNVTVGGGYLTLMLTQKNGTVGTNPQGVISNGAEIESVNTYGYGTYEWNMRMSSTAQSVTATNGKVKSGQVSAGFLYNTNSQTELDFEVEGQYPTRLEMTNWYNPSPANPPTSADKQTISSTISALATSFNTYKLVWTASSVKYYVNNRLVATNNQHVPSAPAHFIINHWGTDSTSFGGPATVGVTRYELINWVRYTAPGATPIPVTN